MKNTNNWEEGYEKGYQDARDRYREREKELLSQQKQELEKHCLIEKAALESMYMQRETMIKAEIIEGIREKVKEYLCDFNWDFSAPKGGIMKKVILTKKRLKALDLALTFDDILYAKFDRMYKEFQEYTSQWNRRRQVVRVIQKKGNINYVLRIISETKTEEGIFLEVV